MPDPERDLGRSTAAIALLSCAVILFEIAITRILSVVLWYHWAFLCISLAMLGLGAPGVWFSLVKRPARLLGPLVLLSAVLVPAAIVLICHVGKMFRASGILFSMACLLLPMLSLGGAICLLLMEARGKTIGRMYGCDLAGACVGALIVVPLLNVLPTPQLIAAIGFLPLCAHLLLRGKPSLIAALIGLGLAGALVWGEPFALRYTKTYEETQRLKPIYERWTSTARLTIFDHIFWVGNKNAGFGWGRGTKASMAHATQYWIEQDGCAGTPLPRFRGDLAEHRYLFDDVTAAGYELRRPQTVAIIGAGGGRDVLTALLGGARHVDAVELNGGIVRALSGPFRDFSGDVYHQPGVNGVISEGRSFLTRTPRRYQMVQISLIDSWAATAAGAFALSENNLYTREAIQLYLRRLTDDGVLSISRWVLGPFWVEVPRLAILVQAALRAEGVADPGAHVAVMQGGRVGTMLVSRRPLTAADIDGLRAIADRRGFTVAYPRGPKDPPNLVADVMAQGARRLKESGLRIAPPTDDKPFFFQVLSPFSKPDRRRAEHFGVNTEAVYALQLLMLVMLGATLLLFFLPFPLRRWFRPQAGFWRGSAFFFCIGVAFMLVEIPWLQKFILYLGHPSYATTVVLGALLLGASIGSMVSARVGLGRIQRLGFLLPLVLCGLNLILAPVFSATLGWSLGLRIVATLVLLSPAAFLMGLFFPQGMVRFGDANKPWFWAMNGAAGVLSSVVSLALAMELGLTRVALIGSGCYLLAWLLLMGRAAPDPEPPSSL